MEKYSSSFLVGKTNDFVSKLHQKVTKEQAEQSLIYFLIEDLTKYSKDYLQNCEEGYPTEELERKIEDAMLELRILLYPDIE